MSQIGPRQKAYLKGYEVGAKAERLRIAEKVRGLESRPSGGVRGKGGTNRVMLIRRDEALAIIYPEGEDR